MQKYYFCNAYEFLELLLPVVLQASLITVNSFFIYSLNFFQLFVYIFYLCPFFMLVLSSTFLVTLMLASLLIMRPVFIVWPTMTKGPAAEPAHACPSRIGQDQIHTYFRWLPTPFTCGWYVPFLRRPEKNLCPKLWPNCILGSCWYLLTGMWNEL